jgi:hypothetical protein
MVVSDVKALEIGRMNWKKAEDMLFLFLWALETPKLGLLLCIALLR